MRRSPGSGGGRWLGKNHPSALGRARGRGHSVRGGDRYPPRRRLGLAGAPGWSVAAGRHGCHGANTCLRTHCIGVDSALLRPLRHGNNPAEFRSDNSRNLSSSQHFFPQNGILLFFSKITAKKTRSKVVVHSSLNQHGEHRLYDTTPRTDAKTKLVGLDTSRSYLLTA